MNILPPTIIQFARFLTGSQAPAGGGYYQLAYDGAIAWRISAPTTPPTAPYSA